LFADWRSRSSADSSPSTGTASTRWSRWWPGFARSAGVRHPRR